MAYFFWAAFLTLLTVVVHALGIFCINQLTHFMIGRIRGSISSYSTIGLADHGPAGALGRLLGPYESALGMLMFGLSGAYLVHVRDLTREQAKAAARLL